MKKRKTLTRLLCAAVSVATVATVGGMALADETDVAEVEETEQIVEEQAEEDAEVIADVTEVEEPEAEETEVPEEAASEEGALEAEEITEEVEVIEDEVIVDVIADEDSLEADAVAADEEVITVEEEPVIFEEAEAKNGWAKEDGKWYYYQDGEKVKGWLKVDGKWYYFDNTYAYMMTGGVFISNEFYIFGTDGALTNGWVCYDSYWFYMTNSGAKRGWFKSGKNWYYFVPDAGQRPMMLYAGLYEIDGYKYLFDERGVMQTGWTRPFTAFNPDCATYYCDSEGHLLKGWQKIEGKWYYLTPERTEGLFYLEDTQTDDYHIYYFDENGAMQTGWVQINNPMYQYGTIWYYFGSDGDAANGWEKIGNKWYYFEDGNPVTGWRMIEGNEYYFGMYVNMDGSSNPNVGVMQTGWQHIATQTGASEFTYYWYYFGKDGAMTVGWKKIDNKWYFFGGEGSQWGGRMYTGRSYIYNPNTGEFDNYYFSASGVMQTNCWVKYGKTWVYYGSDGLQVYGWTKIKGNWYYFNDGVMTVGLRWIDGTLYDFGKDGVCTNPPANP